MTYLQISVSANLLFHCFFSNLQFHFCSVLIFQKSTHQQHKKENTRNGNSNSNSTRKITFEPSDDVFTNYHFRRSFVLFIFAEIHFHCCLALIVFHFRYPCITILLSLYLYKFTQHHNITAATKENRVGTEFVILFT